MDKTKGMPGFTKQVDCCQTCAHSHEVCAGYEMPSLLYCLHAEPPNVVKAITEADNTENWPEMYEYEDQIVWDTSKCDLFKRRVKA